MKQLFILGITLIAFASCKQSKSYSQQFEQTLEVNIETCSRLFIERGVDSLEAQKYCRCQLKAIFKLDSAIMFQNDNKTLSQFLKEHETELREMCGEAPEPAVKQKMKESL